MLASFYLVIQGKKSRYSPSDSPRREVGTIEVRKKKPATNGDEIAVKLDLEIPDSLFIKPTLRVSAQVPDTGHGPEITTDVQQDIAEVIRERTGLKVNISVGDE